MIEDFDRRKEELLDRATMLEVADALGLEPAGKKDRHCPAHNDTGRPNLHLYDKEAHCFACGFHADALALVAKVKNCDFKASFDFLAGRFGLPLLADAAGAKKGRGRGLGNKKGAKVADSYPKPSPLPSTPSPTLVNRASDDQVVEPVAQAAGEGSGLGNMVEGEGAKPYPKPVEATQIPPVSSGEKPQLPPDLWRDFALDDFAGAWAYMQSCTGYRRALGRDGDRYVVGAAAGEPVKLEDLDPEVAALLFDVGPVAAGQQVAAAADDQGKPPARRRSLRVEVFAALLDLAIPSSQTPAGEWLHREKGITPATQDRFGLRFLDDWKAVAYELKERFGVATLEDVGIYGTSKDGGNRYFVFARHRLLFPFYWKGEPVDVQGRDVEAADKQSRFRNTTGANPIPYNADDLLEARATGSKVFICEGATDTLALAQSGRLVVGIVGTGGFKAAWLDAFDGLDVYLALDNDQAGQKAAKEITKVFLDAGHRAPKVVKLPEGIKDVNQFFRSNPK